MTRQGHRVQSVFTTQAPAFGAAGLTLGRSDLLEWIAAALPLTPSARVLDVAAGTGHLSRHVAPRVATVTAVDLTGPMLREARRAARADGVTNLALVRADAVALPFARHRFDLVTCRLAVHHFAEPRRAVAEMARVARPGGAVAVVDLLAPDDEEIAGRYNRFERHRDPSHVAALTRAALRALVVSTGSRVDALSSRDVEVRLDAWLDLTRTPAAARATIVTAIERELAGGVATGLRPFRRDGALGFTQTWAVLVAATPLS